MFQGADYIFAIQDKDFKFWKIVDSKVTINAQPYFLDYAPAGREDITVLNQRNMKYWCIDRSVATGLNFVNDGAQILKYILLNKGMEEKVYLSVLEQQLYYEPYPTAELEYTVGQSPFTANATTSGTITGTPGDTVMVRMMLNNPDPPDDNITGNFDVLNFVHTGLGPTLGFLPEQIYTITIPASGVIDFSFYFTVGGGSLATGSMELLNENGTSEFGYGYWYKQRTRTEFDLTTYSHEGSGVKCATLEEGLAKFLKSNENTTIEIPFETEYVKMDGVVLHNVVENFISEGVDSGDPIYDFGNHIIELLITKEDAPYVGGKRSVSRTKVSNSNSAIKATNEWFAESNEDGTLELEYDFPVIVTYQPPPGINPAATYFIVVRRIDETGFSDLQHVLLTLPGAQIDGNERRITGSGTIVARPGDQFFLYAFCNVEGATGDAQIVTSYPSTDNSFFNYKYKYRAPTTYVPFLRPQHLFQKFIDFVGEGEFSVAVSDFFMEHANKVFTSGNALRGLEGALLKWNFSGFFQFWDCFSSVGISEDDTVVDFAEKQDLIDDTNIIDLSEPSELKISLDRDFFYNVLKIGYPAIKNEVGVLNGNESFNTGYEYSMGIMKKPGIIEKVSNIAADPYAIEQVRLSTLNKDTTDYKTDNDVFVLVIGSTLIPASGDIPAHYELDRTLNASATGLLEPDTVFNLALSTHLNFKRNGPWLRSILWLCDYKTLKYQSSDKNRDLEFDDPVYGHIIEDEDENIGGLGDRFITPVLFTLTIPPPDDFADPRAVYQFPFLGTTYTGISKKNSNGLASRKAQTWELLALPDNDFAKLENYYG